MTENSKNTKPQVYKGSGYPLHEALCYLRTRLFELFVFLFSVPAGAAIVLYLRWRKPTGPIRWVVRAWSSLFIYGAKYIIGVNFRVQGRENLSEETALYMGNHQTAWESIFMTVLLPNVNIITKRSAMSIPVFGWGLEHAPMTPIDPDNPGQNIRRLLREGKASIAEGRNIVIFPEGSRVPIGETRPYARGFESLYKHCRAPVVPFVTDAGLWWPSGFVTKRPVTITIRFLPPIEAGLGPKEFAERIETLIRSETDKLMLETNPQ